MRQSVNANLEALVATKIRWAWNDGCPVAAHDERVADNSPPSLEFVSATQLDYSGHDRESNRGPFARYGRAVY